MQLPVPQTDQLAVTLGFLQALEGQRAGICVQPNQALKAAPSVRVLYPGSEDDGDTITSKRGFPTRREEDREKWEC